MITLNCPSCGAEVVFRSRASAFAVCSYCRATLVRHDMNLEAVGKMADLQDEMSPLKLGTTGVYDGGRFEIIGRLRVGYSDGFWNEWHVIFGSNETGWLAEAQGFYAILTEIEAPDDLPEAGEAKVGRYLDLKEHGMFMVEDRRKVTCVFSEGELPFSAAKGRASLSVDLSGAEGKMGTIEYAYDETRVYVGQYLDFDELKFRGLRKIDGW